MRPARSLRVGLAGAGPFLQSGRSQRSKAVPSPRAVAWLEDLTPLAQSSCDGRVRIELTSTAQIDGKGIWDTMEGALSKWPAQEG